MKLERDVTLIKVFNNNIILVREKGIEKILFQKGIGFGKKFGEIIEEGTIIEKVFKIEDKENVNNFTKLVDKVDSEFLALCEEIIYFISENLDEELSESIHIGLIDHLYFVVKRLKQGEEISNPFLVEIETLYSLEYKLAKEVAKKIEDNKGITIPLGEIGFIALHIHSARGTGSLKSSINFGYLSNKIVGFIEMELNINIDRKSLDYARFLTHIRYAIERITNKTGIINELRDIIKEKYTIAYKVSENIGKIIEETLYEQVNEDEIAYLAMHIERFRISIEN